MDEILVKINRHDSAIKALKQQMADVIATQNAMAAKSYVTKREVQMMDKRFEPE